MKEPSQSNSDNQQNSNPYIDQIIQSIIDNNPYGFILRPNLNEKTGGLLNSRYMANLDSLGQGIKHRFKVGKKTAYPISSVIEFLRDKVILND